MSHLFLIKEYEGKAAKFLRFAGPDEFIIEVNGVEQRISRAEWLSLPERRPAAGPAR
jgi:hypothetical protein